SGALYAPRAALERLTARANAPIFGLARTFFGLGIVGGRLIDFSMLGTQTGALAVRVLDRPSAPAAVESMDLGAPRFDARALARWSISRSDLPPGAIVEFDPPSLWAQYRSQLVGVVLL